MITPGMPIPLKTAQGYVGIIETAEQTAQKQRSILTISITFESFTGSQPKLPDIPAVVYLAAHEVIESPVVRTNLCVDGLDIWIIWLDKGTDIMPLTGISNRNQVASILRICPSPQRASAHSYHSSQSNGKTAEADGNYGRQAVKKSVPLLFGHSRLLLRPTS
ncbi:hypothetical protein ES703_36387 [subsurface metagenome]